MKITFLPPSAYIWSEEWLQAHFWTQEGDIMCSEITLNPPNVSMEWVIRDWKFGMFMRPRWSQPMATDANCTDSPKLSDIQVERWVNRLMLVKAKDLRSTRTGLVLWTPHLRHEINIKMHACWSHTQCILHFSIWYHHLCTCETQILKLLKQETFTPWKWSAFLTCFACLLSPSRKMH